MRGALFLGLFMLVAAACFAALGLWQVQRLDWKTGLIAQIEERVNQPVQPDPGRDLWPSVDADGFQYRHVSVTGTLLHEDEIPVYALTDRGAGYWIMTPLRRDDGTIIYINRGYADRDHRDPADRADGQIGGIVTIQGLLRINEGKIRFFGQENNPAENRWYIRDVTALAAHRGLPAADIAPYFIDADRTENPGGWPVGGLTKTSLTNNHLVYILTWFSLSALALAMLGYLIAAETKRRRRA